MIALTFTAFLTPTAKAQQACFANSMSFAMPTTYVPQLPYWRAVQGSFLEGNRIGVSKDLDSRSVWLAVGYSQPLLTYRIKGEGGLVNPLNVGMEVLGWSRMQMLSDFRFPVETVDYYFGAYANYTRSFQNDGWRFRIGHISSHEVDGKDTVHTGSSSHYSREFVEEMTQVLIGSQRLILDLGLRAYFHQVTKIEPWVSAPVTLTWRALGATDFPTHSVSVFASSGAGPVWPCFSAGIRAQIASYDDLQVGRASDVELFYYNGASWAGTDAGAKVSQLKLQIDVRGL